MDKEALIADSYTHTKLVQQPLFYAVTDMCGFCDSLKLVVSNKIKEQKNVIGRSLAIISYKNNYKKKIGIIIKCIYRKKINKKELSSMY